MVKISGKSFNIGPIKRDWIGESVVCTKINGGFAYCHNDQAKRQNYDIQLLEMVDYLSGAYSNDLVGKTTVVEPTRTTAVGLSDQPGTEIQGQEVIIRDAEIGERVKIIITGSGSSACVAEVIEESPSETLVKKDLQDIKSDELFRLLDITHIDESTSTSEANTDDQDTNPSDNIDSEDSDDKEDLRKKAIEHGERNVSNSQTSTTKTELEYSRSSAVVDYVKDRANGKCEGCDEPAPFTSVTGDPYLHAHHVHELSQGGSDTPDTVIALCPNCHYRVHHGEDGEEYNQYLQEKVKDLETN